MRVAIALLACIACKHDREPPRPTEQPAVAVVRDASIDAVFDAPVDAGRVIATLPSCEGAPPVPAGARLCRGNDDCAGNERCEYEVPAGGVTGGGGCGAVQAAPPNECQEDRDCRSGRICEGYWGGCWDHMQHRCVPGCPTVPCDASERCAHGRCEPRSCKAGFRCAKGSTCAPASDLADEHGCALPACHSDGDCPNARCSDGRCVPRECKSDTDCDCGGCVSSRCWSRLGVCVPHLPPPA